MVHRVQLVPLLCVERMDKFNSYIADLAEFQSARRNLLIMLQVGKQVLLVDIFVLGQILPNLNGLRSYCYVRHVRGRTLSSIL